MCWRWSRLAPMAGWVQCRLRALVEALDAYMASSTSDGRAKVAKYFSSW